VRAWGTQRDVTAQKTALRQLEESEEKFRALVTATSDVIYQMNTEWAEMRTLEGKGVLSNLTEPVTSWLEKYIWPEDREQVLASIKDATAQKAIFELEHRVFRADGSPGWTFSRAVPILDEAGNISEWFGAASDITARKHAEEALKLAREESESRKRLYETITSSTPDLIYVFDLDYRFTYVNSALLQMWGKTWEEAVGNSLQENGYEAWHATMHEREIDHVINTKTSIRGEVSFHHAELGRRIYDYIFSPVINDNGEVEAIAGTSRDITDIKAAEELLKQGQEKLESLVAERTRELQRSNEDLEQFAHVASHDLKEPVRKMLTYSMILRDEFQGQLNAKAEKSLAKIVSSAVRMHAMIDGVLLYSSLHNIEQTTQTINLNETLLNIESDLEILFKEKKATIRYTDLPTISGSPVLIYQLFYNLVSNSLKFARPGIPPVIEVKPFKLSREIISGLDLDMKESFVAVRIEDNGIGFHNEHAEHIFRAFIRLNSKDKFEGTGLGLSLCQKIVERHHGAIYAEGMPNQGAAFTIVLPK
ncbi:MAG: PAS domain-containing sensor histidine kinase, partial [Chitinophagaceae bacterium]